MVATPVQLRHTQVRRWLATPGALMLSGLILVGCATQSSDPFRPDTGGKPESPARTETSEPAMDSGDVVAGLRREAWEQQAVGEWEAAAGLLERALRIDASKAELYHQIAEVRLGQERFAEAEQVAAKGLSLVADDPELEASLWRATAQARSGQGDMSGAREARERACALGYC
ncbi:hypothetical protein [Saccharospirillum salsuginis]|uniref:Tetratricopeptide repeat protein n=1 Tax=Saccharospirillum salsuginis TaxID=418750 RepID=A0A918KB30_9GAMM|nr:hypothetical protein [Saccharospirillum salsuginis]GGX55648.1 hypothetical protein GCM10007392_24170 [Saccharospirillum salsuginis]